MIKKKKKSVVRGAEPPVPPEIFPARFKVLTALRGIPLAPDREIEIRSAREHALFLQCSEVYRLVDLLSRNLHEMVDTYSKYRTRDPFREGLALRYFEADVGLDSSLHPEVEAHILSALNRVHELRLRLSHVDALPFTVKEDLMQEIAHLQHAWNHELREAARRHLGWELLELEG